MILPDGFEARVSSYQERDRFINRNGVKIILTFAIFLPIAVSIFFSCYVWGIRHWLVTFLEKSDYYSTQAALVCVGQTYTLYVAIMDTLAVSTEGIAESMKPIIIILIFIEWILFSLILIIVIILTSECCSHVPCTKWLRLWFVIVGLFPPIVCLSSHLGIIIEGWASIANHGTAMMLFYSLSFIYLFVSFKKVYLVVADLNSITCAEVKQCVKSHKTSLAEVCHKRTPQEIPLLSSTDEGLASLTRAESEKTNEHNSGLNFRIILFEMLIGIPFLGGVLVYIAIGFTTFPVLGTDDAITDVYNFGRIAFIFAIFLLTYVVFHQTSSGIVSENVIKFWKYLYEDSAKPTEKLVVELHIESDGDQANALSAALLFSLLQWKPGRGEENRCKELLLEIVGKKESSGGDGDGSHGGGDSRNFHPGARLP